MKKTTIEKATELFAKIELDEALEVYSIIGEYLHNRIEEKQIMISAKIKDYDRTKEKIKS